jgi:hypothetical protein
MFKKLIFIALFIPQLASAAGFELQTSYGVFKNGADKGMSQLELRVGYTFDFGLFLGGFYSLGSDKFVDAADQYAAGPTIGYQWKGIYSLASYMLAGESDLASGGIKYGRNSGYQVTLGYRLLLIEDVYLGSELTYRNTKYGDKQTQGISEDSDRQDTTFIPAINLQFKF